MKLDLDFSQHPAFAAWINTGKTGAGEYRKLMAEIDAMTAEIYAAKSPWKTVAERWAQFDTRAQPMRKAFDRLLDADGTVDPTLVPELKKGFRLAIKNYAEDLELLMTRMKPDFEVGSQAREWAAKIDEDGGMTWEIPSRWMNPLREFLKDDVDALRRRAESGTGELLLSEPGELQQALLRDYCRSAGVLDALSALYGTRFEKIGYNLHVSTPGDTWYRVYDDLGLPVAPTAQMHYDLGYEVPKAMVYLNDVDEQQGPFSYHPGSQRWEDLGFWLSFRKQMTYAMSRYGTELKLPQKTGNTSWFRHPEVRKAFASMPEEIRNTGHPGDHIMEGSELSRSLLAKERKVTGGAGTLALFCGAHVLHRGGIARQGERWALQVCFWPQEKIKLPSKKDLEKVDTPNKQSKAPASSSFFGRLFGQKKTGQNPAVPATKADAPAGKEPAPVPPGKLAGKTAAEPPQEFSNKRFSLGLKQILGDDLRLSIVDVGGAVNLQPHWHRFHQVADYAVYEPHQKSYQDLLEQQKSGNYYRHFRYFNEALSGHGGLRTLYKSNVPTGSSLLAPKAGGLGNFPENSYLYPMAEEPIQTFTLAESLNRAGVTQVHGIKLDTQGTELEILRGLGAELSKSLLFVEMEIGVIEHYEGESAMLENAIPLLRGLGLDLFDLRASRGLGNAVRLKEGSVAAVLGRQEPSSALAQRVNEVDAIFIRDPRTFIDSGAGEADVRRVTAVLCAHNLYSEAIFAVTYATMKGVMNATARDAIFTTIRQLFEEARLQVKDLDGWLSSHQWQNWGQYMWVPAPST